MPTVTGTLPELIGYSPEKLYLQIEGQSAYLDSDGHAIAEHLGAVVEFEVTPAMTGTLYVAQIRDTVVISGTPVESTIWTGYAILEAGVWLLVSDRPFASSGSVSAFTGDALAQITELRGLIQNSEGATLLTTVRPGGKLALKAGDDYVASETYTVDVPIDDPSESAYLLLTRSQTQSIKFGASRRNSNKSDQIVGTAQKAAVYKNAGKTFVPVEISGQVLTNLRVGDNWLYDIQVTSATGKKRTVCSGPMEIEQDNAT